MKKSVKLFSFLAVFALLAFWAPSYLLGDDRLHKAAYYGQIEKVKSILKEGINPDDRDSSGGTALHASMFQDNTQIIILLLNAGLDVNAQGTYNKYTPLHDAVWANNLKAAKILIKHGAKTNIKGRDGFTAYEKAVDENKKELASYLKGL